MSEIALTDLIEAHPWQRALFTTYAFSASFFEAVVLDALVRRGVHKVDVLTDPVGLRMAFADQGAVRIGREYAVEPIAMRGGVFHPKIVVLEAEDDVHIAIGSGNLTFGGWGGNLEAFEHLHAAGFAEALRDTARFFETLASEPRVSHGVAEQCELVAAALTRSANAGRDDGKVRVLDSLTAPIADGLAEFADHLGGAVELTAAAPFWDATGIDNLVARLGVDGCAAHVHPAGAVEGTPGLEWPYDSAKSRSVIIEPLEAATIVAGRTRRLHAKLFEVVCKNGRLIVSGSPNATWPALFGSASAGNAEVAVCRIDRSSVAPWAKRPTSRPSRPPSVLETVDEQETIGILRASIASGAVAGEVLTSWTPGPCGAVVELGSLIEGFSTFVDDRGRFRFEAASLDGAFLSGGRLLLRLERDGARAQGFLTFSEFSRLAARVGAALPRLLRVIAGTGVSEDVAAIVAFFLENPEAFSSGVSGGWGEGPQRDPSTNAVPIAELMAPDDGTEHHGGRRPGSGDALETLINRLFAAIKRDAGRPDDADDDEDNDRERAKRAAARARGRRKLEKEFKTLFEDFLKRSRKEPDFARLVLLTQYVCRAREFETTKYYVERLVEAAIERNFDGTGRGYAARCAVLLAACDGDQAGARLGRQRLKLLGAAFELHEDSRLDGFVDMLVPGADLGAALAQVEAVRTPHEEALELRLALAESRPIGPMEALRSASHWPEVEDAIARDKTSRFQFVRSPHTACPKCQTTLVSQEQHRLRREAVAKTNCLHGLILLEDA